MMSALLAVISNHNGKYYVSLVAADGDRDPNPKVALVGPVLAGREGSAYGDGFI